MRITFPFEYIGTNKFGKIFRPMVYLYVLNKETGLYIKRVLLVDTGADLTIFPRRSAYTFGIDLLNETTKSKTSGIGGEETIYLYQGLKVKLGDIELSIPCGFIDRNDVPSLLGRQQFMELFKVTLENHKTIFQK